MLRCARSLLLATSLTGLAIVVGPAASAATPPDAPAYVDASTPGAGLIRLSWPAPASGSSPITDYVIQVTDNTAGSSPYVVDTQSTKDAYTVAGLVDGHYYYLSVAAVNGSTGQGAWSDPTYLQSVPGLFGYKDAKFKVSWLDGKPNWNIGAYIDRYPTGVTQGYLCGSLSFPGDPHGNLTCSNAQYQGTLHAPSTTVWYGKIPLRRPLSLFGVPYDQTNNVFGDPGWVTVPADLLTSQPARTVAKGSRVTLSTRATDTTGAILDSRIIPLFACRANTCTKVAAPVTNSNGVARKTVTVDATTTYRWRTGIYSTGASVIPAFAADLVRVG